MLRGAFACREVRCLRLGYKPNLTHRNPVLPLYHPPSTKQSMVANTESRVMEAHERLRSQMTEASAKLRAELTEKLADLEGKVKVCAHHWLARGGGVVVGCCCRCLNVVGLVDVADLVDVVAAAVVVTFGRGAVGCSAVRFLASLDRPPSPSFSFVGWGAGSKDAGRCGRRRVARREEPAPVERDRSQRRGQAVE